MATPSIKKLHPYQERDIQMLFDKMEQAPHQRLLYQLPTGGGKTVVFSEIAKRFIEKYNSKVAILTHRTELCSQTSATLKKIGVSNKIISSKGRDTLTNSNCIVAMVETLRNRIRSKKFSTAGIGLVIIDEAHHNSFRKLLSSFTEAFVIGVTATPFSSDIELPMNTTYDTLVVGENIASLIESGFLAKPQYFKYEVELNSLRTGLRGDFTVSSSNGLYGAPVMLDLLLSSYELHAKGKKTLIFNNGVETSLKVRDRFEEAGIAIRHLDNKCTAEERNEILKWFKRTKSAVLTSVSILTTGFDEPGVQAVILNRATTSVTLYHQMIGRGSRWLPSKKTFRIIDHGNNCERFGDWHVPVNWQYVFEHPKEYAEQLNYTAGGTSVQSHAISAELRAYFPETLEFTFDIESAYATAIAEGKKPKTVLQLSMRQQAEMCITNADTLTQALHLAELLYPEAEWRVKQYIKCLDKPSTDYKNWLIADYKDKLHTFIKKVYHLKNAALAPAEANMDMM